MYKGIFRIFGDFNITFLKKTTKSNQKYSERNMFQI